MREVTRGSRKKFDFGTGHGLSAKLTRSIIPTASTRTSIPAIKLRFMGRFLRHSGVRPCLYSRQSEDRLCNLHTDRPGACIDPLLASML